MTSEIELKPWEVKEQDWLRTLVTEHGCNPQKLSEVTGWSLPTIRTKLIEYAIIVAPKEKARK